MPLRLLIALLPVALSGCATRGALTFDCTHLTNYAEVLADPAWVRDIRADAPPGGVIKPAEGSVANEIGALSSTETAFEREIGLMASPRTPSITTTRTATRPPVLLMLSGGGQWGAYGAGFLQWLDRRAPDDFPQPGVITGVSTGALQSLYLSALGDRPAERRRWLDILARKYAPAKESTVVDRNSTELAVVTGSVAGLKPLQRLIEASLCEGGKDGSCPLIERLADADATPTFVGFVDAETGAFAQSHLNGIALAARDKARRAAQAGADAGAAYREARQCLTGVVMASAAVPAFYQQVRIKGAIKENSVMRSGTRVVYDGGVRLSVFEAAVAEKLHRAKADPANTPAIYVLRNGPTDVVASTEPSRSADALTAATRSYRILVNQSEVGSIAALRLSRPSGPIYLTTADGYGTRFVDPAGASADESIKRPLSTANGCVKTDESAMFEPEFMRCLQALGRFKVARQPWWQVCAIQKGDSNDPTPQCADRPAVVSARGEATQPPPR